MLPSAFEWGESLKLRDVVYYLFPDQWDTCDLSGIDLSFANWTTIKYLNNNGDGFNDETSTIPNDAGGLYMFSIKCPVIEGFTDFPVYIGRAQLSKSQNLKKRCREYFTKFKKEDERPLITRMFQYWSKELHLSFMVLHGNEGIIDSEARLINSLKLPFNSEIPDKVTKQGVKAFNL